MDAWNQEQEMQARRAEEKREKRVRLVIITCNMKFGVAILHGTQVLDNWKRLIRGMVNKERIMAKYMKK